MALVHAMKQSLREARLTWLENYRRYGRRGVSQRAGRAFRKLPPREQLRRSIREVEAIDKWSLPEPEPHWLPIREPNAPGNRLRLGGRRVSPARFAWELYRGRVPEGYRPTPMCGVRRCVRPDNLQLTMILDFRPAQG